MMFGWLIYIHVPTNHGHTPSLTTHLNPTTKQTTGGQPGAGGDGRPRLRALEPAGLLHLRQAHVPQLLVRRRYACVFTSSGPSTIDHPPTTNTLSVMLDQLNPPFPPQTNTNLSGQINSTHAPFPPTQTKTTRYARGVTLMGDALGHSWVGLLLARAIDPQLQTPVPLAFTYKLLVGVFVCVWFVFGLVHLGGGGCGGVVVGCRVIGTHRHPPNHLPDTPNKTPIRTRSSSSRAPGAKTEL